jgi:transcriptional regulator with XRE-family HTH domain
MNISSNIKFLRLRKGHTQDETATSIGMKRSTLSGYENNVAQPNIEALLAFSKYFNISVDTLIKIDLSQLSEFHLSQLEKGSDVYLTGSKIRVLATTVDNNNEENVELVPLKAKAGYTSGFADPEYIKTLQTFQLPFLSRQKKYRTFQISGDSMLPIPDGSWVTAEFIQNWKLIRDKHAYIILTLDDGIVFKVVENKISTGGFLRLHSFNKLYEPYNVYATEIKEVWKFVNYISTELPETNKYKETFLMKIDVMQNGLEEIKNELRSDARLFD